MRLHKLILSDFRNFFGEHVIEFSHSIDKPLTIIIGSNGSGKTTVLNSIYWIFTGEFNKQFPMPSALVNKDKFKEGGTSCFAELHFSIDEQSEIVIAKRIYDQKQRLSRLSVFTKTPNGVMNPLPPEQGESFLESFLPGNLAKWFIFAGEAVGEIQLEGVRSFRDDLRKTFGFTAIAKLLDLINDVRGDFNRQIKGKSGKSGDKDEAFRLLTDQIENMEQMLKEAEKRLDQANDRHKILKSEWDSWDSKLRSLPQAGAIEERKKAAERRRDQLKLELKPLQERHRRLLAGASYRLIIQERLKSLSNFMLVETGKQRLPSSFGETLLDELLKLQSCLCGTPLCPGSKEALALEQHRPKANTAQLDLRVHKIKDALRGGLDLVERFETDSVDLEKQINKYHDDIQTQSELAERYKKELAGSDVELIRETEAQRSRVADELRRENSAITLENDRIRQHKESLRQLNLKYHMMINESGKDEKIIQQLNKLKKLEDYVLERFKKQEAEVIDTLNSELTRVFSTYLSKNYSASIDADTYAVTPRDVDGRAVGLSTGESYVLKFALIAAIVGMAGMRTITKRVDWISDPIIAPLVLDAPFSVNDVTYRSSIAENLVSQSSQLIMMFDADKWNDDLRERLSAKVGRFYCAISRAKGSQKSILGSITLGGTPIVLNEYESERDESYIAEQEVWS